MKRIRGQDGSAAVELVLLAPLLLALLALVVAAGRVLIIKSDIEAVARETARTAAAAPNAEGALNAIQVRSNEVASELGLDPSRLEVDADVGAFTRGSPINIRATYRVVLDDLPAFGLFPGSFEVSAHHLEIVEKFKSR